jgi:hypothetical protein
MPTAGTGTGVYLPAWLRRCGCVGVLTVVAALSFTPSWAAAHPVATTAVLLDIRQAEVVATVQMPLEALSIAYKEPLTAASFDEPGKLDELRVYLRSHLSVADHDGGAAWTVTIGNGDVEQVDGIDHLVFQAEFRPPGGLTRTFDLTDDAIVHRLLNHDIYVAVRTVKQRDYTALGVLDWHQHTITVPTAGASTTAAFTTAIHLGVRHIARGADHLLFLTMLLLPAPLIARRGRWVRCDDIGRSCRRVVHVVTAFTLGHSITLCLAALGYVHVPSRVVESAIAVSILVSGIHAIRPLTPRGEPLIAASFGLMHGLAFATLLGDLGLTRGSLVANLLGFNLGIEVTQLTVVAMIMPSLLLLSRTPAYPVIRIGCATFGIALAGMWLAERTTLISNSPVDHVGDFMIDHPLWIASTLAALAITCWAATSHRPATLPATGAGKVVADELADAGVGSNG